MNTALSPHTTSNSTVEAIKEDIQDCEEELAGTLLSPSLPPLYPYSLTPPISLLIFSASVFLVTVPVFIEAPLVRALPWISVGLTGFWIWLSLFLMSRKHTYVWGDLLFGFSWSWLTGSIYWGWFRWEPLWHLPIEAIALPFAVWCLCQGWGKVGNWFYLGSLFGTVLTDVYFYLTNLMPYWRQIMKVEAEIVPSILKAALVQVQTPLGQLWALILGVLLLSVGFLPLARQQNHWYAFGGAVFSTILVDTLFLLAAVFA
jgi:Protein of unknown function (DUF3120)